jgi:hypothetical protein
MAIGTFKLPISSATTTSTTWTRPADWLTIPTPGTQEVIGLMAVYDDGGNYVAVNCQGAYTVDWGDGTAPVNYATGITAAYQYTFASLPSGTLTSKGFRQALVRITPQGAGNLTSVGFGIQNTTLAKNGFSVGWLDVDVRIPNGVLTFNGHTNVVKYGALEKLTVRSVTPGALMGNLCNSMTNLKSVYIEPSITANTTNFSAMFGFCVSLEEAPFMNMNSATITSNMFGSCFSLKVVPNYNLTSTTNVAGMFDTCNSLTTYPAFNMGTTTNSMFQNCTGLINAPTLNTSNVLDMTSMFSGCFGLTSVALFDTIKVTNFTSMFLNCRNLETIPLFNTIAGINFTSFLQGCGSITSVPLLNTPVATTMTNMFNGCGALMELPALNTSNVTIVTQMLSNLVNLKQLPAFNLPVCITFTSWISNIATITKSNITGATRAHSYSGNSLGQANIVTIFTNLGTASGAQTITVSSNPGYLSLTAGERLVATNKGWTIA